MVILKLGRHGFKGKVLAKTEISLLFVTGYCCRLEMVFADVVLL